MSIILNGKKISIEDNISLLELINVNGYNLTHIAAAVNGNIIKKENFFKIVLKEGDEVEILQFAGGGRS